MKPVKPFYVEGNNGGDYLSLTPCEDGMVTVELGHCCVVYFRGRIPIDLITSALASAVEDNFSCADEWGDSYASKLRAKIQNDLKPGSKHDNPEQPR